jgi:hypothetical protein
MDDVPISGLHIGQNMCDRILISGRLARFGVDVCRIDEHRLFSFLDSAIHRINIQHERAHEAKHKKT